MVKTRTSFKRVTKYHLKQEQEPPLEGFTTPPRKLKRGRSLGRLSNSVKLHPRNPLRTPKYGGSERVLKKTNGTNATPEPRPEEASLGAMSFEPNSLLHRVRQLVYNCPLKKSTFQSSEKQVPSLLAEDGNLQNVQKLPASPRRSVAETEILERSGEETGSREYNNEVSKNINKEVGENSNNAFQGRSLLQKAAASINLTEFAQQMEMDGLDDEVDSFGSNATLVSVGGYRVKPEYETVLGYILDKYGDIASNHILTSVASRSFFMELLCEVIQKLMATNFVEIKVADLETMMDLVKDFEKVNIEIRWLKMRLDEIHEAKNAVQYLREHRHYQGKAEVQNMKEDFEACAREEDVKRAELEEVARRKDAAKCKMLAAEEKYKNSRKVREEEKAKLRHVVELGSLLKGLIEI